MRTNIWTGWAIDCGGELRRFAKPLTRRRPRSFQISGLAHSLSGMSATGTISTGRLRRKIGQTLTVLVDAIDEDGTAIARSTADAPEIDGVVYVEDGGSLAVGDFAEARVVDADEHDLYAESA